MTKKKHFYSTVFTLPTGILLVLFLNSIHLKAYDFHTKQILSHMQQTADEQIIEDECLHKEINNQLSVNLLFLLYGAMDVAYYHWFDDRFSLRVRPVNQKWRYGEEMDHEKERREFNIGTVIDIFDGDKEGLYTLIEASYFDEKYTFVTGSRHESGLFPRVGMGYQWKTVDCYFFSFELAGGIGPRKTVVSPSDISTTSGPTNYFSLQWGLLF